MKVTKTKLMLGLVTLVLLLPSTSMAAPVVGSLNITGDAQVGATFLNFLCTLASPTPCAANYGNFASTGLQSGSFATYANQGGYIHSINNTSQPINSAFLLSNFLFFAPSATLPSPDIALDLTFLYAGTAGQAQCGAPEAPGQTCTPALAALVSPTNPLGLSAFNLTNTATGSTASFSVSGNARRISTGEVTPFNGVFTAQFTNSPGVTDQSFQDLLAVIASGGTISNSYSATFTATAIPEPAMSLLVGAGLVLVGIYGKRRQRRSR